MTLTLRQCPAAALRNHIFSQKPSLHQKQISHVQLAQETQSCSEVSRKTGGGNELQYDPRSSDDASDRAPVYGQGLPSLQDHLRRTVAQRADRGDGLASEEPQQKRSSSLAPAPVNLRKVCQT